MAVCDAWSLKYDSGNLKKVEILPYFDSHSMDCKDGLRNICMYTVVREKVPPGGNLEKKSMNSK